MFNQLCVIAVCADKLCLALGSFVSGGPLDQRPEMANIHGAKQPAEADY